MPPNLCAQVQARYDDFKALLAALGPCLHEEIRRELDELGYMQLGKGVARSKNTRSREGNHEAHRYPKRHRTTQEGEVNVAASSPGNVVRRIEDSRHRQRPKIYFGMRIIKDFPGHGRFEGVVRYKTGRYYKVYYPEDGDEEDLSQGDFDQVEILDTGRRH